MSTDTKRKPEDKIAEPPKKWRNWYKATRDGITIKARRVVKLGDIYPGFDVFPSKELAEEYILKTGCNWCVYLGAEPEQ